MVVKAPIYCTTFMVPSCAAQAAPVLPTVMIPAIMAPISQTMVIPTRSARRSVPRLLLYRLCLVP